MGCGINHVVGQKPTAVKDGLPCSSFVAKLGSVGSDGAIFTVNFVPAFGENRNIRRDVEPRSEHAQRSSQPPRSARGSPKPLERRAIFLRERRGVVVSDPPGRAAKELHEIMGDCAIRPILRPCPGD